MDQPQSIQISSEPNTRLHLMVGGLCAITINRTHEGIIVDVYDAPGADCLGSLVFEDAEFSTTLEQLIPLKGECGSFHSEVRKLQRPYTPISEKEFKELESGLADYYKMPDGRIVTFGAADQGYALMPLNEHAALDIQRLNPNYFKDC